MRTEGNDDDVAIRGVGVSSALNNSGDKGVDVEGMRCGEGEGINEGESTLVSNVNIDKGDDL